ncbi:uncharacterized protein K441DRAFT_707925 [Cenococcum geophilum 1.58]|uniref:uncharacterized protein n=1 Tax=Cenococcum geophilum 1.58 TaxID=794803 RepID=UPI0035900CB8|nr:hypothetical protein K441DRAFT_707925 [Cenococcum geophilum 1.58]
MWSSHAVRSSNSLISTTLLPGLVAVFVVVRPVCYIVSRSREAAEKIIAECKTSNPDGQYIFIKGVISLMSGVDRACEKITSKESVINLLFLTPMVPDFNRSVTAEDLHLVTALGYYARMLFALRLLPPLTRTKSLSRVFDIAAGALNLSLLSLRGHLATLTKFGLESLAIRAPSVSFIQTFPGIVVTPFFDTFAGDIRAAMRSWSWLASRWIAVPIEESWERNLFLPTSARYPPAARADASGVRLVDGMTVARGIHGKAGSSVCSLGWGGESTPEKMEKLLTKYRDEGMVDKVWEDLGSVFKRTTGSRQ